ncbi:unnamed protein product [Linum tenue]|uniref:TIR domain-containing protein n=1 Tax=Linum tenue TaxID=586396 RepID=A0AAV0JSR8_9ROSI|nr:unnamed protein product [Linum tenue]
MDYMKWAVTVIGLLLPLLIILYKLWLGRRISNRANNVDNASRTLDSIASASGSADSDTLLPLPFGEYEVFMNFRGPDTRYQITDILFRFLVNLKIRTFKDDDELRKGEGIWPNLVEAIEQSKIYVTIFSENYAYSKWCLKELAVIVEHQERNQGCIILPIFYMVDPRDVRHQSGPYLRAFRQHENFFDEETIRIWKAALNKVGALKGWHVKSNDEQGAIADLVTGIVWSHLSKNNFLETDKLIGMDDHIEVVKERLALDSPCMTIVGIHGIGGIGKTTIAKAVYNKVSPQFDRCSFVEDVREMLQQRDGIIILQKHIISDILRKSDESIANASEGIGIIRDRISRFKSLIVLDDVDEKFEFDEILGNIKSFLLGSRFIITSRNVRVLSTLTDDCKLYRVREMSHHHSLQLFCNHAFKRDSPPSNFETLSKDIVYVAAGLPLTLKVVGSLLFQEEEAIWKDKLRQLKEIPEEKVVERLKINYDTLNEEAKQIFLDIACFFIGEDKELPSYMWSDCGLFPITNINILIQRSVIEIVVKGSEKKLLFHMHDQLRDMGREIVRQENTRHPWKRSRIWSKGKALDMLCNQKGSNLVESIRIRHSGAKLGKIQKECFMNLSELRYLEIEASMLIDDFSNYVPSLRWLRWSIGFSECIPKFSVENLVIFEVLGFVRDMSEALRHIKIASKLKVLKLSRCWLDEFPEFPRSGSLEILDLRNCFHHPQILKDLHIGNLGNLKVLRLRDCGVREIIGGTVGMMPFENLKVLHLQDCGVRELTCGTFGMMPMENLKVLHLLPSSLTTLLIIQCPKLQWLPNLENLENLTYLSIGGCPFLKEILGLVGLKSLETLRICDMKALRNVDGFESLYSLKSLTLRCCDALERLPSMGSLSNLLNLYISNCHGLTEIQDLGGLESLQMLDIHDAKSLSGLFGFETLLSLNKLEILKIGGCPRLTSLQFHDLDDGCQSQAAALDSLQELNVCGTTLMLQSFCRMIQLLMFPSLTELTLGGVKIGNGYTELLLDGLESMEGLVRLHLYDLASIRILPSLSKLGNLERLTVKNAPNLQEIEGLGGLKSLKELHLIRCTSLESVPADELYGLERLESLDIRGCTNLKNRSSLRKLEPTVKIQWPNSGHTVRGV